MLEKALNQHPAVTSVDPVETNIVIFTLNDGRSEDAVAQLAKLGIACFAFGPDKIRLVTHLDMSTEQVQLACERIAEWRS